MFAYYNDQYETIIHSRATQSHKDRQLAQLMTELERHYRIPMLRSAEWEKDNRPVIALYRKISLSRKFS